MGSRKNGREGTSPSPTKRKETVGATLAVACWAGGDKPLPYEEKRNRRGDPCGRPKDG